MKPLLLYVILTGVTGAYLLDTATKDIKLVVTKSSLYVGDY